MVTNTQQQWQHSSTWTGERARTVAAKKNCGLETANKDGFQREKNRQWRDGTTKRVSGLSVKDQRCKSLQFAIKEQSLFRVLRTKALNRRLNLELFLIIVGGVQNEMGRIKERWLQFWEIGMGWGRIAKNSLVLGFCRFVQQSIEECLVVIHLNWFGAFRRNFAGNQGVRLILVDSDRLRVNLRG